MHIKIYETNEDYECRQVMYIDGERECWVGPLEPEDAIIGRGLHSCVDIKDYMEKAYEAGKNGEAFEYEYVEGEEE
jgi:hypothetical protein